MSHVFSVRELTGAIKSTLEGEFPFVWVKGQVSSLSRPRSGHIYFSLVDEDASLAVVWFKGNQRAVEDGIDPLTGEVVENGAAGGQADLARILDNGQEVLCAGRINVYPPRGQYQLVAELVQDMGLGRLFMEFEAMKQKLLAKGYFEAERKRPLPRHPLRVALVTAPGGAALRDFLRIADERGWGAGLRIFPCLVQGDRAPKEIAAAIDAASDQGWADVVVAMRGGGSLEDLWAFNTEEVADAVFRSKVPVVSAVGHEVDTSIADLVADARAATPSHAAQMLWPERAQLVQEVDALETVLSRAFERYFAQRGRELESLEKGVAWLSPATRLARLDEQFSDAAARLDRAVHALLERKARCVDEAGAVLARLFGPEDFARRGQELDDLARRILRTGPALTRERARDAADLAERLARAGGAQVERGEREVQTLELRLDGLNPEKPLERGYSLVYLPKQKKYLRSVRDVAPGDRLDIFTVDGSVPAEVAGPRTKQKKTAPKSAKKDQEQLPL